MNSIALQTISSVPTGQTIVSLLSHLEKGEYALMLDKKTTNTKVLKRTPSHGTPFYRHFETIDFPFHEITCSGLIPKWTIELNASPAGSESQEYADALVFSV